LKADVVCIALMSRTPLAHQTYSTCFTVVLPLHFTRISGRSPMRRIWKSFIHHEW